MDDPNGFIDHDAFNQNWGVEGTFNGFAIDETVVDCYWMTNGVACNTRLRIRDCNAHLRTHHGITSDPAALYRCRWHGCFSNQMTKPGLERHVKERHTPGMWACPNCSETVTRKDTLLRHMRERCPGNGGHA
ncbi:hypothetical protein BU15DRAFT_59508 [Melanogaster broomeanus]|nr:hypothetical protein BU15DRAFT_59508 [Melanogaster broomeanus]